MEYNAPDFHMKLYKPPEFQYPSSELSSSDEFNRLYTITIVLSMRQSIMD